MKIKKDKQKTKKQSKAMTLYVVCMGLLGGFVGFLSIEYMDKVLKLTEETPFSVYMLVVVLAYSLLVLAFLIQLSLHEFGHLVMGLASGYKFCSFRIFNFMLVKKDGKMQVKNYSLAGTAGQCLMAPPEKYDKNLPVFLYNAGGVMFNVALALICTLIIVLVPGENMFTAFLFYLALTGFLLGIMNGLPIKVGDVDNDARNIMTLLKNEDARYNFWCQMKVNELTTDEIRLKDMPDYLFEVLPTEEMNDSMSSTMGVMRFSRYMDQQNFAEAKAFGEDLVNNAKGLLKIYKYLITMQLIYCEMVLECRTEVIDSMYTKELQKFTKAAKSMISVATFLYVHELLYTKDREKTEKQMLWFEKLAKKHPHTNEVEGERELIDFAQKQAETIA